MQGSTPRPQSDKPVYLLDEKQTGVVKKGATNDKGEFIFKDVPPGNYVRPQRQADGLLDRPQAGDSRSRQDERSGIGPQAGAEQKIGPVRSPVLETQESPTVLISVLWADGWPRSDRP